MKRLIRIGLFGLGVGVLLAAQPQDVRELPYAAAGLSEREAAVHLLNRFAYGPRPGEVDRVVEMGLERWLARQLAADLPDAELTRRLAPLQSVQLSDAALMERYLDFGRARARLIAEGQYTRAAFQALDPQEQRQVLRAYFREHDLRSMRDLFGELLAQKLARARYSENQLQEVLTDFWFNHFNVAWQDNQARPWIYSYERSAIRPHVLGSFRDLLGATARHPAMLTYLDNAQSSAPEGTPTTMDVRLRRFEEQRGARGRAARRRVQQGRERMAREAQEMMEQVPEQMRPRRGVNENYARELMELHTLGVDGGYTQQDVEEVARAFTGWSVLPTGPRADEMRQRLRRNGDRSGFVLDGHFLFNANRHDATEKTILGHTFPEGSGIEEGERVLDLLSRHPSTAQHLARKLAIRFVSEEPPQELVDRLAVVFQETGGEVKAVVEALAYDPAFWQPEALHAKVKSPLELLVSALRILDAEAFRAQDLATWLRKMGQPLYAYQAPTGFPDRADVWINTGTLLNRMNFGMQLATGQVRGLRFDLPGLNDNREPESVEAALATYTALLLPERTVDVNRLLPVAQDPAVAEKIEASAAERPVADPGANAMGEGFDDEPLTAPDEDDEPAWANDDTALARVVGVILGSPEFQRR